MRKLLLLCTIVFVTAGAFAREDQSPFRIRGIKGLWWEGLPKYRLALPLVAQHRMNFLMFCYSSFPASGKDWRSDYQPEELRGFRELAEQAHQLDVTLCLSFNPGIWSKPPLTYSSEEDFQIALKKVRTVHQLGINTFALCLDDINQQLQPADAQQFQTLARAQSHFVNRLAKEMKAMDSSSTLIFCPSAYTTREARSHLDYIETIGREIDPAVQMFWTGPVVCSPTITAEDARVYAGWIRRKPIVWDNYPVNDMFPWRPLLAPVKGRSADLASEVEGVMANPMKQWHASTIPLATLADYLSDPVHYDAEKSLAGALTAYPESQQDVLRSLLDVYGTRFLGERGYPPQPAKETAAQQLANYEMLEKKLSAEPAMKDMWDDVRPTLEDDLKKLREWAKP